MRLNQFEKDDTDVVVMDMRKMIEIELDSLGLGIISELSNKFIIKSVIWKCDWIFIRNEQK